MLMSALSFLWSFRGRFGRANYWLAAVLQLVAFFAMVFLAILIASLIGFSDLATKIIIRTGFVFYLISVLAVHAKRLHDLDLNGWLVLVLLIPLVGLFVLIACAFFRGTVGPNKYGPDPLEIARNGGQVAASPQS
jgi:uncharacterized membrane protein YhaH (DUF805 family)